MPLAGSNLCLTGQILFVSDDDNIYVHIKEKQKVMLLQ